MGHATLLVPDGVSFKVLIEVRAVMRVEMLMLLKPDFDWLLTFYPPPMERLRDELTDWAEVLQWISLPKVYAKKIRRIAQQAASIEERAAVDRRASTASEADDHGRGGGGGFASSLTSVASTATAAVVAAASAASAAASAAAASAALVASKAPVVKAMAQAHVAQPQLQVQVQPPPQWDGRPENDGGGVAARVSNRRLGGEAEDRRRVGGLEKNCPDTVGGTSGSTGAVAVVSGAAGGERGDAGGLTAGTVGDHLPESVSSGSHSVASENWPV